MIPPVDINEIHQEFWTRRHAGVKALSAKSHLVAIVARREAEKARYIKLALSETDRIERIRHLKSFELELESVAEEYASLPVVEAQRRRAQKPRGKVTGDGKTLNQVIEELVTKVEYRDLSPPELWPHFYAELDQHGLDPEEIDRGNLKKSTYAYDFNGRRKTITYRRFANFVSKYRKRSR